MDISESYHNVDENLADNILKTRYESFHDDILENAKDRIIDTIGCLIGGADAPGNQELIDLVKYWGGREESSILIHGGRVPAQNAAMVNCIMARSLDSEPITAVVDGILIPTHISGTTIMTAITAGEMRGASGREIITAMLVGEDLASRLMAAASSRKRVDSIGTVNVFGAAAIAGKLLGLDRFQMRNALGICLDNLAGSYQNVYEGTTSFKLSQGLSARNGIFSAQLAQKGWTAAKDPFLGKFAYFYLYCDDLSNLDILTKDLGKKYYTEAHFKPYPSCRYNHGSIQCILSLEEKYGLKVDEIKDVTVNVSRRSLDAAVGKPFRPGDFPCADALFSYQYAVANVLLRKRVIPQHFSEEFILDPEIQSLVKKIRLKELPEAELLETRVDIVLKDGRKLSESVKSPKGDQEKDPISRDDVKTKFMSNAENSPARMGNNAGKLLKMLDDFEDLENVDEMISLMLTKD
ncbi:MAG: MmgE/PrpD family protein [Deltaproteobacteria bacterium]|nr:MmgE/PrpD family protein [Deltaproteobacteria bacterium]